MRYDDDLLLLNGIDVCGSRSHVCPRKSQCLVLSAALQHDVCHNNHVAQIFEKYPTKIKNYGIWVRYQSRTGYHNAYKEYRDTTLNGAVQQLYEVRIVCIWSPSDPRSPQCFSQEMGSRHRARRSVIQIIKTATVPAAACKRESTTQFHDSKIKFPHPRRLARPSSAEYRTIFKAQRPNVAQWAN